MKRMTTMTQLSVCLTAFILICSCLLPLTAAAQKTDPVIPAQAGNQTSSSETAVTIDFSDTTISEPVDVEFWKRQIQKGLEGVEIDSSGYLTKVIFHRPVSFISTTFEDTASFLFATFEDTADFTWATFDATADFSGATFEDKAFFMETEFKSTSSFRRATFEDTADFTLATFEDTANFIMSTFEGTVSFSLTKFKSTASFRWATFDATACFSGATFEDVADFTWATFDATACFSGATFEDVADFTWATFEDTAHFGGATFEKAVNFRWTKFQGKVDFGRAKLPDSMDFRNVAEITREIDFTYCLPPDKERKCRIALEGADISKIKLNMKLFELSFPEDTFIKPTREVDTTFRDSSGVVDTIVVAKKDTIVYPTYDQQCSIYEQVLKKLENDGFMDSYEILDIEYRRFKYDQKDWPLVKNRLHKYIVDPLQSYWWNFGYDKERILFVWTPLFFGIFFIVNLFLYRKLTEKVYATIGFLEKMPYRASWVRRTAKKVLQVMAYTGIVFFGLKMDVSKFKKGALRQHPWLFTYLMFIYVVGLVCLGFIVNIIFTR